MAGYLGPCPAPFQCTTTPHRHTPPTSRRRKWRQPWTRGGACARRLPGPRRQHCEPQVPHPHARGRRAAAIGRRHGRGTCGRCCAGRRQRWPRRLRGAWRRRRSGDGAICRSVRPAGRDGERGRDRSGDRWAGQWVGPAVGRSGSVGTGRSVKGWICGSTLLALSRAPSGSRGGASRKSRGKVARKCAPKLALNSVATCSNFREEADSGCPGTHNICFVKKLRPCLAKFGPMGAQIAHGRRCHQKSGMQRARGGLRRSFAWCV